MRRYKVLLVVGDGLGDRPIEVLGNKTPLQVARTENIDLLLRNSVVGLMDPIAPGVRPGSDTSHLALLGLDPFNYYSGRGVFEALGAGAELSEGDVALRGNFATVNEDMVVKDRRAGRNLKEAGELVKELNERIGEVLGVKVRFYRGTEHRLAVVLSGRDLGEKVSDTDPHEEGLKLNPCAPLTSDERDLRTCKVINELTRRAHEVLRNSRLNADREREGLPPANVLLLRGASKYRAVPSLRSRTGMDGACVTATAVIRGICKALELESHTPPGATGGLDTDYLSKGREAARVLREKDFVLLHVKATDAASHDGLAKQKVEAIEGIDKAVGEVLMNFGEELVVAVTGDHSTPVELKEHSGDPVPLMIHCPNRLTREDVSHFDEGGAKRGSLRVRGLDLMNLLLNYSNRAQKFGE
ncbi:phosphoglycerate mutase [Sulfodiicoccus acidiphilus]|uniref:2,3-bisphosphoglycerate-independent phosphoglycerate mutase n=1 Tax=Sulfodiicoccus acidiphilus TaxID=1670455 RepID=A0A348B1A1_9CREN|nr:2,3-bisphosphoglycerate-independent phosphoglycerate mutase [Sulfodiicoccus acidiphilus]BBD71953.1 phosphoglycerate mutase [Sulfodiicoccus acidiphilus]GGT91719.1 phosphoglycerate mutase [Sulfodiicoccus acidiphilus]